MFLLNAKRNGATMAVSLSERTLSSAKGVALSLGMSFWM
jgi:hypothetical protein